MSDKPYGRKDLPQQQTAPEPSTLPEEFQFHPHPYDLKQEDLEKITHDHKEDLRPLSHHGAGTQKEPAAKQSTTTGGDDIREAEGQKTASAAGRADSSHLIKE